LIKRKEYIMKTFSRNTLIGLVAGGALLSAGSVTIPNSFTAGETAKASEVNANFTAVKTAVDGNAADITTNANNIATNANDIATNQTNIATNTANIAANQAAIENTASMWVRDHEGNIHPTVTIGNQVWMADNMYVTTYPDGSPIDDSSTWTGGTANAFAYPIRAASDYVGNANSPVAVKGDIDIKRYGLFYQWNAAMAGSTTEGAQGICPSGWHIPTDADWDALQVALGSNTTQDGTWSNGATEKVGDQLKVGGKSGFSALFSGDVKHTSLTRENRGLYAFFWSSSSTGSSGGVRGVSSSESGFWRSTGDRAFGDLVRCLKN
jgi:uncharacterized protein (TIGR02145 family)